MNTKRGEAIIRRVIMGITLPLFIITLLELGTSGGILVTLLEAALGFIFGISFVFEIIELVFKRGDNNND